MDVCLLTDLGINTFSLLMFSFLAGGACGGDGEGDGVGLYQVPELEVLELANSVGL